jgi:hypothetical protein
MIRWIPRVTPVAVWAFLAGCGGAASPETATPAVADVVTREEIATTSATTAYDAIQQLRPAWLQSRGVGGAANAVIQVVVNGIRRGDVQFLRSLRTTNIAEVRFVAARDAIARWGAGFESGAIVVVVTQQ